MAGRIALTYVLKHELNPYVRASVSLRDISCVGWTWILRSDWELFNETLRSGRSFWRVWASSYVLFLQQSPRNERIMVVSLPNVRIMLYLRYCWLIWVWNLVSHS